MSKGPGVTQSLILSALLTGLSTTAVTIDGDLWETISGLAKDLRYMQPGITHARIRRAALSSKNAATSK